jgi:glutamine amidotransferase-like uncharacterized protein
MVYPAIHRLDMSRTVVFAGKGSSHSWTWMADFLERMGYYDARFLDAKGFADSLRHETEIAVVSGGDGYAIAESLRGPGFSRLKDFIINGGLYIGICAGAYLPLPSRFEPFNEFNISTTKIENIDCSARRSEGNPRVSVRYGSCSIVHPVRGEVDISSDGSRIRAPLHGGPVFKEPDADEVLLRYVGFGGDAEYQVDQDVAEAMVIGRPAAIQCRYGDGRLMLFGPHLEHPDYPIANRVLQRMLGLAQSKPKPPESGEIPVALARTIADLKVAALGLEGRNFLVGKKVWDAGRFLELVKAIEKRAWYLDPRDAEFIQSDLSVARGILLRAEAGAESDIDQATALLLESARVCVDSHFRFLVAGR